ncbi:hypothetical protein SEVIR_9G101200v4 [Setaria viridis]|uniref:Ribosomal protein L7/L12 C-terminal domain-containing protein n=2 Tax=Setaria TaxID=4554 RepID=K4AFZ7_SETIT|nr:uncharacterized protein LOC101771856 [Setaria italica]XP_034571400.1 50S ribosomal protein L7/L12-like [Setaria viridis]RCV41032.1 hypothetical protein SETIT_9G103300v2 [Setaria italica]TKV91508.1 hypothetical protein SEVIR_9G101200v2 [Setaria viridis]
MASRLLHLRRLLAPRPTLPAAAFSTAVTPTPRVSGIVDEICGLTLLEASSLADALRGRLGVDELPPLAILTGGAVPLAGGAAGPGAAGEEAKAKEEKMAFDVKLEGFDAAAKLKIIKELRAFTNLGLKEAKELVEKAPAVLKAGVPKEEAESIAEKMRAVGAKIVLE